MESKAPWKATKQQVPSSSFFLPDGLQGSEEEAVEWEVGGVSISLKFIEARESKLISPTSKENRRKEGGGQEGLPSLF